MPMAPVRASSDSPCKDAILKALTRLNEKATLRAAAEELSIIVRALDQESLSALVQSICSTTGAWDPKPVAKKECIRVLAQLPLPSCPVADIVLQHHLPKVLVYLKKTLQDTDGLVREATCEALASYAQGFTRLYGCEVPGSSNAPVVRVVFECLSEQKKESQMGASQALLKMSPFLSPLDKELVKVILKLLRSSAFLGTAQLLAAIASTDPDTRVPVGLLKHGASAFIPYLNHLMGQPSQPRASAQSAQDALGGSSGGGSTASSTITVSSKPFSTSGILGCLSSKDWAVRRAAADAVHAVVLLVGPLLEPEDCWGLGDPGSVTGRCLSALEECRFDKVKEARDAAREAAALIRQLHRFVAEQGSGGDWPAWAGSNLPNSGWQSPAPSSPHSPLAGRSPGSSFKQSALLQKSPIAERFRRAAVESDVIIEPGSRVLQQELADAAQDRLAAGDEEEQELVAASSQLVGAEVMALQSSLAGLEPTAEGSTQHGFGQQSDERLDASIAAESSSVSASSARESRRVPRQQPQQQGSVQGAMQPCPPLSARSTASGSRPSSVHCSRPSSANGTGTSNSRRASAHDQPPLLRKQPSQNGTGGPVPPGYAAGTRSSAARGAATAAGSGPASAANKGPCPLPCAGRARPGAKPHTAGAWQGPSQQEWQAMQQAFLEEQQLVEQLQQQAAADQAQHAAMLQEVKESSTAACAALQERVTALEVQVQRQQMILQEQRQLLQQQQALTQQQQQQWQQQQWPQQQQQPQVQQQQLISAGHVQAPVPSNRSPTRCSSSPASSSSMTAAARAALSSPIATALSSAKPGALSSPRAGLLGADAGTQRQDVSSTATPSSSSSRLYKSAEWVTPQGSTSVRKSLISVIDPLTGVGHRSYNSLLTPASGGLRGCESAAATPADLEAAYADALRGDRGGVHLLRLIQKTGPVWPQLSSHTCRHLLEVFIKHVRDGVMLHRVLPWLWRLADEDAGLPEVPPSLQQQLLEALECCPAAEDLQAQEKVCLLLDTLKTVWTVK